MSNSSFRDQLKSRAWWAMLSYAFFRWESAVIIAMTLILVVLYPTPFPWWPWWGWIALGVVAEGLIIVTSVTDVRTGEQVVAEMFREEYNPAALRTPKYRQAVERALEYRRRIERQIVQARPGVLRDHLADTARQIGDWIGSIYRLALRLEAYETDDLLRNDMQSVPAAMRSLSARLEREHDDAVRAHVMEALAARRAQAQNLQELQMVMEKAGLQMENALSAMGTVYSQIQLIGAKDVESGRAQRLREDIAEQVRQLQEIVDRMDEVYKTSGELRGKA